MRARLIRREPPARKPPEWHSQRRRLGQRQGERINERSSQCLDRAATSSHAFRRISAATEFRPPVRWLNEPGADAVADEKVGGEEDGGLLADEKGDGLLGRPAKQTITCDSRAVMREYDHVRKRRGLQPHACPSKPHRERPRLPSVVPHPPTPAHGDWPDERRCTNQPSLCCDMSWPRCSAAIMS